MNYLKTSSYIKTEQNRMDYKNGKIYAIRSHMTDDIYIGSTTQILSKRMNEHRCRYKSFLNGSFGFRTANYILEFEDAYIELLEEYPCNNKMELCKREGELIRQHKCVNKRNEGINRRQDNKAYMDKWWEKNRESYNKRRRDKYALKKMEETKTIQ